MRRSAGSRLGAMCTLSVVLSLGAVAGLPPSVQAAPASPATPPAPTSADRPIPADGARARTATEVELPRPVRGASALRLLGDHLDEAAARNDLTEAELTQLLTTDPSVWLDLDGIVFFKDEMATAPADDPVSAAAPLDQTFLLHSKPGSAKTIFLDFDGGTARATAWHVAHPATPTTQPAWDLTGNPAVFDDAERTAIQTVWQTVAEDYAPFDVDVTTADPGPAGTDRASAADTIYGSHVLITPSDAAHDAICGGCGGVAYLNVFDAILGAGGDGYGYRQPAWVFPQKLANSAKNIAEAVSHEVGHNFGLRHDGNSAQGYDTGHGAWAPIMGVGYYTAISQWSKGDYGDANNQEDDVAILRGVAGSRTDEAPTSIVGAPAVPSSTAYVTSRTDVDTYLLGTCTGAVTLTADPLPTMADLDLKLTLLDATGQVVATDDPASAHVTVSTASGMGASLSRTLTSGTYYASVDGVGNGDWSSGYDDYGSLGAYTLTATGCGTPTATTTTLGSVVDDRSVTLTAGVTAPTGTPAGTVQFRDRGVVVGTQPVVAGVASLTMPDLTRGDHVFDAAFVPSSGTPFTASTSSGVTSTIAATLSATTLQATGGTQTVSLAADVTVAAGGASGTVEFREGPTVVGAASLSAGSASLSLTGVAPGEHTYTASFVPTDHQRYDGSSSDPVRLTVAAPVVAPPPAPSVSASTTKVRAPRKAKVGTKPVITVKVLTGSTAASGTVVVKVGKTSKKLTLKAGKVRLRLSKVKAGKVRVKVTYLGNATTTASAARWTIKVAG